MDIEVLLESFDGAFAPNTLRDYRKADNGRYRPISVFIAIGVSFCIVASR